MVLGFIISISFLMEYFPTIGLEIHAELKTRTKMFCDSKNDSDETRPNANICPVCMGHPGTLPVINKEAVKYVLKVGLAIGGELADFTEFDRKNYFYPDIPKGYQISQYKYPLVSGGNLNGVAITRVHLEEDTGTSLHEEGEYSLLDYNRAGVPLMEMVTEPVIKSAKEAGDFARELQLLLRCLGVSDANMEKGELRIEANISISKEREKLGTKVEVKNLNSFKSVERAIESEKRRQAALLEAGERIVQETRGWDEQKGITFSQRRKEESHDYRYFPEPDLPKLYISRVLEFAPGALKKEIPELPSEKREHYQKTFGIKKEDAEMYVTNPALGEFLEEVIGKLGLDKKIITLASNYITSDLAGILKTGKKINKLTPDSFAALIEMIGKGKLTSRGAKDTLVKIVEEGGEANVVAKTLGVIQNNDESAIKIVVEKIISANPKVVADYRSGKKAAMQFLVGQGMKATRGSANPEILRSIFEKLL